MKLKSFRVYHFRSVLDSEEIKVGDHVTALVGKNESGKTSLLHALDRLNSSTANTFDIQEHYPRWLLSRHRKQHKISAARPIEAWFELDQKEKDGIEESYGKCMIPSNTICFCKKYDGNIEVLFEIDEAVLVNSVLDQHKDALPATLIKNVKKTTTVSDALEVVRPEADEQNSDSDGVTEFLTALDHEPEACRQYIAEFVRARMPKFFYFDEYSRLPGRIDIAQLAKSPDEADPARSGVQAARALLSLAETDFDALQNEEYELRKSELEAVSNELTEEVLTYWSQNSKIAVELDLDKSIDQNKNVTRMMDIRVKDTHHGYTSNFGDRSSGFQWFFSFLAAFSEFEHSDEDVVVLLDEPALSLHGRAQADFLKFVEERLAPNVQVIYTTHSPFLIDMGRLDRVRIVEDRGRDEGAKVSDRILSRDRDSLFPLQGALGYDFAQNLFVGPNNLVLEGTSDYAYLITMSHILEENGRSSLNSNWRCLPVGSVTKVPSVVAFLGPHVGMTIVIDSGTPESQRIRSQIQKGRLNQENLIQITDVIDQKEGDIEDLFDEGEYVSLFNAAYGTQYSVDHLGPGTRIVKRIEQVYGEFDHGKPAEEFLKTRSFNGKKPKTETLEVWERLVTKINETNSNK